MSKPSNEEGVPRVVRSFYFNSHLRSLMHISMLEYILEAVVTLLELQLEEFINLGSGWELEFFESLRLGINDGGNLKGGTYLPNSPLLDGKNAVINYSTSDNECFTWAIAGALCKRYLRVNSRKNVITAAEIAEKKKLVCCSLSYPVTIEQIPKFLEDNKSISLNIYGYEEVDNNVTVSPLFVTAECRPSHIDLLLIIAENGNSHYTFLRQSVDNPTAGLSRLLGFKGRGSRYYCKFCLQGFSSECNHDSHQEFCAALGLQRVTYPNNDYKKFNSWNKTIKSSFVVYADFECLLVPSGPQVNTCDCDVFICQQHAPSSNTSTHVPCAYSIVIKDMEGRVYGHTISNHGDNVATEFITKLIEATRWCFDVIKEEIPCRQLTKCEWESKERVSHCGICSARFAPRDIRVKHHCHVTGEFLSWSHQKCNQLAQIPKHIPVVLHNFKNYDSHFILQGVNDELVSKITGIPQTREKFLSFSLFTKQDNELRFIDSCQFLNAPLATLVENAVKNGTDMFRTTKQTFSNSGDVNLCFRKGVFPYCWLTDITKLNERCLPPKSEFFSDLTGEGISEEDYVHAQNVWTSFECQTMADYCNHYCLLDTCLLADIFEAFREKCMIDFSLEAASYFGLPGFAFDAALRTSKVELEYLKQEDMYNFVERAIRGGICNVGSLRKAEANNPYMGDEYDPRSPTKYIIAWDANNLYGKGLSEYLPTRGFRWVQQEPKWKNRTLEEIEHDIKSMSDKGDYGYFFEVDLSYDKSLHKEHSDYPLAPEKVSISPDQLSDYQREQVEKLGISQSTFNCKKLISNLLPKCNYVLHYRALKLYLKLGMKLLHVHRVLSFKQEPWLKPFVDHCTSRRRDSVTGFDIAYYKSLININFGKLIENKRKYMNVHFVFTRQKAQQLIKKPTVQHISHIEGSNILVFFMKRLSVCLDKPIYGGACCLDDSKVTMYDFHYNYVRPKYGDQARLLFTDTDSLNYVIETNDIYHDMIRDKQLFDLSEYSLLDKLKPKELLDNTNKKRLGKMKDNYSNFIIVKCIALKPKMYAMQLINSLDLSQLEIKKCKGIKKCVVKNKLKFQDYSNVLENNINFSCNMIIISSNFHNVETYTVRKSGLNAFDSKRYYSSKYTSLPFGHYETLRQV
ncbi:unnamed protein product [Allacma fusca]|uniref:DNA-directed DNA polymerase n=1 Tax=Allacma fusca TaxID=39272 RepID=A0A8J2KVF4_9HEXA|nr:unnamed protein product [Allacma fusca]